MNILILHRIPYHKIDYHRGIDHTHHHVTYIGTAAALANIPTEINCQTLTRPGIEKTAEEVIAILEKNQLRFDRILSLSEYELLDAAQVREHFGVEGPTIEPVKQVRDKVVMKTAVAAAGIRVPGFFPLTQFLQTSPHWQNPIVLKPLDGASSEDVKVFSSETALLESLQRRKTGIERLDRCASKSHLNFEVEEFIPGPIIHFDGLIQAGQLKAVLASQYVGNCLDYAEGKPLGSIQIDLNARTKAWVSQVLDAVSLTQGSFHLEAIASDRGLVFLEVANRVGGADVVDTFELATGIHLPSAELKICIGETLELPEREPSNKKYGWYVFPGHHYPFEYCRILEDTQFRNHPFMVRWQQLSTDQKLPKSITYQSVEVPLAGLIGGDNSQKLQDFLRELFTQVKIEPCYSPA